MFKFFTISLIFLAGCSQTASSSSDFLRGDLSVRSQPQGSQPQGEVWSVQRIADGDTITVTQGARQMKVRFCGIDAPEKAQPLGRESGQYLRSLVQQAGNQVLVTPIETDRYGRTVGELFIKMPDGSEKFLQGELVKVGLAYHYAKYSSNCPNRGAIINAEEIAKTQRLGVWSRSDSVPPWEFRRQQRER